MVHSFTAKAATEFPNWNAARHRAEKAEPTNAPQALGISPADRLTFVDNVRWAMILLVLSMHAADTYSPFGNWYYTDRPPIGLTGKLFFLTWQSGLQAFFMALLFFIAGVFSPRSYDAKGPHKYLTGRLLRLGLPTLLYVFIIGPVTEFYLAHSWRTTHSFAHEMGLYVVRARFLSGTGPMWFCVALLILCGGYTLLRLLARPAAAVPSLRNLGWRSVASLVVLLTVSTFAVRIVSPEGRSVLNMQPADFASYIIMFAIGVAAGRSNWLMRGRDRLAWTVAAICIGAAALLWGPLLFFGGAASGQAAAYSGGLHWQSAGKCLWEALVCVGMSLGVLLAFRRWFNRQGPVSKFLSDNAFAVYVIHPPVLIVLAQFIAPWPLAAIPKFALLWGLTAAACFGVAAPSLRRLPWLRAILS